MTLHHIGPERRTLHGPFSRDMPPVLTIASGDTVRFRTLDAGWGVEGPHADSKKFEPRDPTRDSGHALCGPVFVAGARAGATIAIHIDSLRPGAWGWQATGGWDSPVNRALGVTQTPQRDHWSLDAAQDRWRNDRGQTVASRPFLGVMGMPDDVPGLQSTTPPRRTGGNMDCKELVAGSTLYLPVGVEGGLFSTGDGHGAQGDGEVCGTAIECPMEQADLTFTVRDDIALTTPRAHTPSGWLTFGFDRDLNAATYTALDAMLVLMRELHGLERLEALSLASLVVDVRVTQIVNDVCGVHCVLPHDAFGV